MPEPFNMAWLIQGGERPQNSPQVTVCGFVDTPESPAKPLQPTSTGDIKTSLQELYRFRGLRCCSI